MDFIFLPIYSILHTFLHPLHFAHKVVPMIIDDYDAVLKRCRHTIMQQPPNVVCDRMQYHSIIELLHMLQ